MIGEELKRIRKEKGWTQQRLADEAGVSLPMIGMVEKNTINTTMAMLSKIATALGVSIDIKAVETGLEPVRHEGTS